MSYLETFLLIDGILLLLNLFIDLIVVDKQKLKIDKLKEELENKENN